jgi:uncharacterized protein
MARVYLDASPVVYGIERVAPFWPPVGARVTDPGDVRVASELTRMECLVFPIRNGNATLIQDYEAFFATMVAELRPFDRTLFERATNIRARFNFKTPDALHLAAAMEAGCDVFLTGDQRLTRFTGITVEVVT